MPKPSLALLDLSLLFFVFAGATFLFSEAEKEEMLEVIFLDVGQGDAILLQEGSWQVLIDGGRNGREVLGRLGHYVPFWDRRLDMVIATHPDSDHIGGLPSVIRSYHPSLVLTNGDTSDTDTSTLFEKLAREQSKEEAIAQGTEVLFPSGAKLEVLYPARPLPPDTPLESNEGSVVARLTYGDSSFLFTGDLPQEEKLLGNIGEVDILKVAHHGSRYSTSDTFLDGIRPREAVVSVGENSYGHPAPSVLENLRERSISVARTDEEGDIRYRCSKQEKRCDKMP